MKTTLNFNGKAVTVDFVEPNSTIVEGMFLRIDNLKANYRACCEGVDKGKYAHLNLTASMSEDFKNTFEVNLFMGSVCKSAYREVDGTLELYRPYDEFDDEARQFAQLLRVSPQAFFAKYGGKVVKADTPILVNKFSVEEGNVVLLNSKREVYPFHVIEDKTEKK